MKKKKRKTFVEQKSITLNDRCVVERQDGLQQREPETIIITSKDARPLTAELFSKHVSARSVVCGNVWARDIQPKVKRRGTHATTTTTKSKRKSRARKHASPYWLASRFRRQGVSQCSEFARFNCTWVANSIDRFDDGNQVCPCKITPSSPSSLLLILRTRLPARA